uniref:Uncharacterized protein n=1 Tax=Anopheles darlingi TaxID=43151 RepID=A0A2M4DT25_ANODA
MLTVGVLLPSAGLARTVGSVSSNELCNSAAIRSSLCASLIWLANDSTVLNDSSQYTQRVGTIWVPPEATATGSSSAAVVNAESGSGLTNLREPRFSVALAALVAGELEALSGIRFGIGRGRFLGFVSASSSSVETALSNRPSSSSPSPSSSSSSLPSSPTSLSSVVVVRRRAASRMVSLEYGMIWLSWCNSSASLKPPPPRAKPLLTAIDVPATERSISSSSFGSPEAATSCCT